MPGPLHGFRVVDVTQMISGPLATMMLADQGADVVKVEPPGHGDLTRRLGGRRVGMAPIFATANRNKRSIVIDLRNSQGIALLRRLVARSDLFVQNFRPGVAERMGMGEATLRAARPDLVYVSISGFGESGPYAHRRVYDPVIQALSGLASIQGDPASGRPRMVRLIVPDKVTALTAAQAMTAALLARERTGQGQHVRLAMLDAVISFLWPEGMAAYTFKNSGAAVRAQSKDLIFETTDGYITTGAVSDIEWEGLIRAVDQPHWRSDPRFKTPADRERHADARLELMAEVIRTRNSADWLSRFEAEQVPCAPVLSREQMLCDPQVAANGIIVESVHPHAGPMRQARPAARFSETPSQLRSHAPSLGEHTDNVLTEAGISLEEIAELRNAGVIA